MKNLELEDRINISPKTSDQGDAFYADLTAAYRGLDMEDQLRMSLRLILILANQVGDRGILNAALDAAKLDKSGGI